MSKTQFYKAWRKRGATPAEIMQRWQRAQSHVKLAVKTAFTPNPTPEVRPS